MLSCLRKPKCDLKSTTQETPERQHSEPRSHRLSAAGFTFPNKLGDQTPSNQTLMQMCVANRNGCTRVPICSNCLQICTFSHSGELDPSLSDCESGKEKKYLSLTVCRAARSEHSRHGSAQIPVCPSVCLSVCALFYFVFGKMTQIYDRQGKCSCGSLL